MDDRISELIDQFRGARHNNDKKRMLDIAIVLIDYLIAEYGY